LIVVDAGVIVTALADDGDDGDRTRGRLRDERLIAPHLIDLEVVVNVHLSRLTPVSPARQDRGARSN